LQRRINVMEPENGIHALVKGKIKKGVGRSLRVSASLVDFQFKIGTLELEKNIFDSLTIDTEIPLPTEQAVQEAHEIIVRNERRIQEEGRLLILANTRGNPLFETEYASQFRKDLPFPWKKVSSVLRMGQMEVTLPEKITIGLEKLLLSPQGPTKDTERRFEYSFLHGKYATNEVYFDEVIPAQNYRLVTSFFDLKSHETFSELSEISVYPGNTTMMVLSFYVPSEKERVRNKQVPRIDIFKFFGKGTEILSDR